MNGLEKFINAFGRFIYKISPRNGLEIDDKSAKRAIILFCISLVFSLISGANVLVTLIITAIFVGLLILFKNRLDFLVLPLIGVAVKSLLGYMPKLFSIFNIPYFSLDLIINHLTTWAELALIVLTIVSLYKNISSKYVRVSAIAYVGLKVLGTITYLVSMIMQQSFYFNSFVNTLQSLVFAFALATVLFFAKITNNSKQPLSLKQLYIILIVVILILLLILVALLDTVGAFDNNTNSDACISCGGSGIVNNGFLDFQTCPTCNGNGVPSI